MKTIINYLLTLEIQKALTEFGNRRTDFDKGTTFQGVETPSQSRFVGYYDIIKNKLDGTLPPRRDLKLDKIIIHSIKTIGNGDGSDIFFFVYVGSKQLIAKCNLGNNFNCEVRHSTISID
jgi:PTEN phosphatase family protein